MTRSAPWLKVRNLLPWLRVFARRNNYSWEIPVTGRQSDVWCLMTAAQYYLENTLGRKIGEEELLSILKMGEEKALVLSPTNAKDILNICMCCGCCCGMLRLLKKFPKPADTFSPSFHAQIAPDLCTVCGACAERCQMEAIIAGAEYYEINRDRCIGCGLCVTTCPVEAITLKAKSNPPQIPETIIDMQVKIAKERGIIF